MVLPRTPRRLAGVGLVGLALGGLLLLLIDEGTLPRSRGVARVGGLLLGVGAAASLGGLVLFVRARIAAAAAGARPRLRRLALALALVVPAGLAFSIYSLGFYWKVTTSSCWEAQYAPTLEERRRALEIGEARLRSPFSWLPELVGFNVSWSCEAARLDLARVDAGECPFELIAAIPCTCGAERWPEDARCEAPRCPQLDPPRLRCHDDDF